MAVKKIIKKRRVSIPSRLQKQIFQEAGSGCVFCRESEIASLEIHHIDEDPSNNDEVNLILVCRNCHGKITAGELSAADVDMHKKMAVFGALQSVASKGSVSVNIAGGSFKGDVAQTINKFSSSKGQKIQHPPGSLGANLSFKGYVDYLLSKYYKYRKADSSFGRKVPFSHAVIHRRIQERFHSKTFFMPEDNFEELCNYLKAQIDQTILGKRNRSDGVSNYHPFEDHYKNS